VLRARLSVPFDLRDEQVGDVTGIEGSQDDLPLPGPA
jgi:hypothetical protein